MSRKITSTEQQVRTAQDASKLHEWPNEAGDPQQQDLLLFYKAQEQRSQDDWTPLDLISLANLCKMQADVVAEHDLLRAEGQIRHGGKNGLTPIANPRARVVHDLNSSINSLARRLGLTSMSVNDKRSAAKRGEAERAVRREMEEYDAFDPRALM